MLTTMQLSAITTHFLFSTEQNVVTVSFFASDKEYPLEKSNIMFIWVMVIKNLG